jgi:hypothetical protein
MPFDARKMALRGPAAVAVHDDGDVGRKALEVDVLDEQPVRIAEWDPRQQLFTRHVASPLSAST